MQSIGESLFVGMLVTFAIWFFVRLDFRRNGEMVYKKLSMLPEKPNQKHPDREQIRIEKIKIANEIRAFKQEAREYHKRQEAAWKDYIPPQD